MRRRRPRPRRRGRLRWVGLVVVLLVGGGVVIGSSLPIGSYTTGELPRISNVDAVDDDEGLLGLDVSPTVPIGPRSHLVDLTNNHPDASMRASVTLRSGDDGTLYTDSQSGDSVALTIGSGSTRWVDIDVHGNPGTITFDIDASVDGLSIRASRQTESRGGPPGGRP